ncbi:FecR protein [Chitinophaga dinghuensis]|uniref:FecR protein n=1 Tax=Chitinophaga dinghuensis TaxID=1539050 RepID=A0A327W1P0_9BACT|nr:FecR domain-containing protein [Chitinophaga dinghuensis]RAJ83207.1 FecR protein [Chitinophaga dinghuensis]
MQDRLLELFHKYVNDNCSTEELSELYELFSLTGNEIIVKELIAQTIEDIHQHPEQINTFLSQEDAEKILNDIFPQTSDTAIVPHVPVKISRMRWWKWAAAATVAVLISLSGYYVLHQSGNKATREIAGRKSSTSNSSNKATLILSNGQTILLDSVPNGLLATQGQGRVVKNQNGAVIYSAAGKDGDQIVYNTITTPRGGQYFLQLSDGSKVWLNAASSIRFPVVFPAGERKVYITGEAYFEVEHLSGHHDQPAAFIVEATSNATDNRGCRIEVLGTKFNINSYSNEPVVSTTLLEGKVKVHVNNSLQSQVLQPNQQVNISRKGDMYLTTSADVNAVIAWKNGYTQFAAVPLSAVMRQVERWYDVNVQFEGNVADIKFTGKLKRTESLAEFLKILDLNNIKYEINNSTIIIK